jgi:hydroxymethylpyrimidine/phosphomethylpyrimidine kinase
MLSAAITAGLAKKQTLFDAVDHALMAVQTALYNPIRLTKEISLAGIEQSNEKQPLRNRTHEIKQQERT